MTPLLDKALSQRTEVKLKKQKRIKNQLTKAEIEISIHGLEYIIQSERHLFSDMYRLKAVIAKQKLNNQLKELI